MEADQSDRSPVGSDVDANCVAVGKAGAKNAAILAAQILGVADDTVAGAVNRFREAQSTKDTSLPA